MSRVLRILAVGAVLVAVTVLVFLGLRSLLASGLQERLRGNEPFGIRISLKDEKRLAGLAQMVVYPKKNQVFLYFMNTDARLPGDKQAVSTLSASSADKFERYTDVSSSYSIELTRAGAARLLDVAGGLPFFNESPVYLKDGRFQYPQGLELFAGRRLLEYALGDIVTKEHDAVYTSIDRVYRMESVALTVFWRLKQISKAFGNDPLRRLGYSLISTNLELVEISALVSFLEDDAFVTVLEVPLESGPKRTKTNPDFQIKEESARKLFAEYRDKLTGGTLRAESYPVELLNGTERKGLARRVRQLLKDQGPLVLTMGNYDPKPLAHSLILDRVGNTFGAASFARKTGVKRHRVFFARRASQVSLSLLIGRDFSPKQIEL